MHKKSDRLEDLLQQQERRGRVRAYRDLASTLSDASERDFSKGGLPPWTYYQELAEHIHNMLLAEPDYGREELSYLLRRLDMTTSLRTLNELQAAKASYNLTGNSQA